MIYEWQCLNGHKKESFVHHRDDKGCETFICHCGHTMGPIFSPGLGRMLYFEESRGRSIDNLATLDQNGNEVRCPPLKSWKDYEKQKKKAGVAEAGQRQGEKGVWI